MCPDGLCANTLNKGYGGCQSHMRNSKIADHTYLGPFTHPGKLNIGEEQSMQYQMGDVGPFYLSPEDRVESIFDVETDITEKKRITDLN